VVTRHDGSLFLADLELLTPNRKAFMKLVSLKMQRSDRSTKLDKPSRANRGSFATPTGGPHQIQTYAELRQQIHEDLRAQHPDWIQPDGESPMCDSYEARLMQALGSVAQRVSRETIVDPHRLLEQGLT
jgi:hypothetical protein